MTPIHLLTVHAAPPTPPPVLARRAERSVFSGLILAFILLALLLQASFFVGLASGRAGGPDAGRPPRAAAVR